MLIPLIIIGVVVLVGVWLWALNRFPPDDPYFLERGKISPKYDLEGAGAPYDRAQQERALKKQRRQEITIGRVMRRHTSPPVTALASGAKVVQIRRAGSANH